jgi:hypothetical protein
LQIERPQANIPPRLNSEFYYGRSKLARQRRRKEDDPRCVRGCTYCGGVLTRCKGPLPSGKPATYTHFKFCRP